MTSVAGRASGAEVQLGLGANRLQFSLLVAINAFVGAMVGLERAVLPLVASREFGRASATAALSFIAAFGIAKALTNLAAGRLADRGDRRRVLIAGWLLAVPVPLLILVAPNWQWIVAANALLGVSQGLAWSMTVVMKIDLVGPERRGFAMGLNEFAGYVALAVSALLGGLVAARYGLRAGPAYAGIAVALTGLLLSVFCLRDTSAHVRLESAVPAARAPARGGFAINQAGLINNLNDGLAWGLFPLLFAGAGLSLGAGSLLVAVYPAVWGVGQLWTGAWSDRVGRKPLIVGGMLVQGAALVGMALVPGFGPWLATLILLGIGTALVYPSLLAAVADIAPPSRRGSAVGAYRFWRDLGYAVGALAAGMLTDRLGIEAAIVTVGVVTGLSGAAVATGYQEQAR